MARPPRGSNVLEAAQSMLEKASDISELRTLQAVVLPLAYGMSTKETAKIIGRSPRWTTDARNKFINHAGIVKKTVKKKRNRAHLSHEEEERFLAPFLESARQGGVLVVSVIRRALEQHLGHAVALATAYNLLHRHGWRKLAPDKRNVDTDVEAQEDWKKNSQRALHR